jgi:NADH-quinone oxidoreductase subunit A
MLAPYSSTEVVFCQRAAILGRFAFANPLSRVPVEAVVPFQLATVLVFLGVGAAFVLVALVAGALFRPKAPNPDKASVYECGQRPIGRAWFNFNPRFYLIAVTFLLFEVEIVLAYPVATVFLEWTKAGRGVVALIELLLFLAVLVVGLVVVWGKGNLEWIRDLARPDDVLSSSPAPLPEAGEGKSAEGAAEP